MTGKLGHKPWIGGLLLSLCILLLASLNLLVMVQANQFAFSQSRHPYDFYVLLHAASQVFSAPSQLYVHHDPNTFGPYWSKWLWYGASYLYTPMFAVLLAPLSSLDPPTARIIWEGFSYALLTAACMATMSVVPSIKLRVLLALMIFIMPIPVLYTVQTLPQHWSPKMPGMWIAPVYFADYYWGNTNTAILALGLFSYYFAVRQGTLNLRIVEVPFDVLSALFLALDTFKISAAVLIFPFWLVLNRKTVGRSMGFLILFLAVLNSVVIFEPSLLMGYFSAILGAPDVALWQTYEYVWYYTLPLTGVVLLLHQSRVPKVAKLRPWEAPTEI